MASSSNSFLAGVLAAVAIQCFWHEVDAGECTRFQECAHSLDCIDNYVCSQVPDVPTCACRPRADVKEQEKRRTLEVCRDYMKSPEVCVTPGTCAEGDACGWSRDCKGDLYCRRKEGLTNKDEFPGVCTHMGLKEHAPDKGKWVSTQAITEKDFEMVGKKPWKGSNVKKCHTAVSANWLAQLLKI